MSVNQEDVKLTEERSWELGPDGDLAVVTHRDLVVQDVVQRTFNEVRLNLGSSITQTFIEEFSAAIMDVLEESEWVSRPYDVTVTDIDDETLYIDISTGEDEFVVPMEV